MGKRLIGPNIMGRVCGLGGVAMVAASMAMPFFTGSRRLLMVPLARALPLPDLASFLAREGRWASAAAVALCGIAFPAALLLSLLPVLVWPGAVRYASVAVLLRAWRWQAWLVVLLGTLLTLGVRASSGQDGVSVRLGPGAWLFLAGLSLAAAAATLLSRAANPPGTKPGRVRPPRAGWRRRP